jgi:drug/metabolite transporter (DMT)-like permease
MLLLASVSWGVSAALSKVALEQLTPLDLFGVQVATGALVLCAVALLRGARPARPSAVVLFLGVLEPGLSFLLFDVGLEHTAATHGALLLATDSLFTVALAVALLRERLDTRLGMALAAGFVGAVLVSLHGGGSMSSLAGDLLIVAAALAAAGYAVLARYLAPGRDAITLTTVQMLGAAALSVPLAAGGAAAGHSHLGHADTGTALAALADGILASAVPFLLYNAAIARVTATAAGLVLTLVPLIGTLASLALLSETLGSPQVVGGAFVVLAAGLAATRADPHPSAREVR